MMLFHGFKSKAVLKQTLKLRPVRFSPHITETSMLGDEYKHGVERSYCVCMDHPKRTKFANITVDADGFIKRVA